jgi:hydroxymethylbilane synthase
VVLALAGLHRLGRSDEGAPLAVDELLPAPGQGCLALEARAGDERMRSAAAAVTDPAALRALTAERAVVGALDTGCLTPVGALARASDDGLELAAYVGLPDGSHWIRDTCAGDLGDPAALGREVAGRLLAAGAGGVLAEAACAGAD